MQVSLKGIDVSAHNGRIDWAKVAAGGIQFAMIRLGIGSRKNTPTEDRRFRENMDGALAAGVPVGAYLYSYALDATAAKQEAEFALRMVEPYHGRMAYPIVYDVEDKSQTGLGRAKITAMCEAFCDTVSAAGLKPMAMVYANLDWVKNKLDASLWSKCDLWLAHWRVQQPGCACAMWQYSDSGSVPGINGPVDMNICYKDYATDGPVTPPVEPPTPAERTLRPGDEGEDVAMAYHLLDGWGFVTGRKFNQPLEAAVKAFQGKYSLHVDGVIGPKTRKKMRELIAQSTGSVD